MPYFLLVMGKQGICRGSSGHRNKAGWHDLTEIGRPLSGSGYRYDARDELNRRVEVKMWWDQRASQISDLLHRDTVLPWVAIEETWNDKASEWWTFFDVRSAGYASGTDYNSPTKSFMSYIFEFGSARSASGTWPGAIRTAVPKTGVDPERVVHQETDRAVSNLPVPDSLKRQRY